MKVGIKRLIAVFLAMVLCWMQLGSAFASSTSGTQAEEGTNVGSSLYDVTTALTAFANNVLGVNNNANDTINPNFPSIAIVYLIMFIMFIYSGIFIFNKSLNNNGSE